MLGRPFRNALPFVEQVLSSLGTFGTLILGARLLDVADQGALGLLFILLALNTGVMVSFLFQPAAVVVHGQSTDSTMLSYRRQFIGGGAMLTVALVPIYSLMWWGLVAGSGRTVASAELIIAVLVLLLQLTADFQRRGAYVVETARGALLVSFSTTPPRLLALALLQPDTLAFFLVVMAATAAPGALLAFRRIVRSSCHPADAVAFVRGHGASHYSLLIVGPLAWLCQAAPVQLLGLAYGLGAIGILTTLRSITSAANLLIEVVDTQFIASLARVRRERGGEEARRLILRLGTPILGLWLIGLALLGWIGPDLVRWLSGETYAQHARLLLPLWGASLTLLIYRVSSVYFQTAEQGDVVAFGYAVGTLWSVLISIALVLPFGLTGAALALMIGGLGIVGGQIWSSTGRHSRAQSLGRNHVALERNWPPFE